MIFFVCLIDYHQPPEPAELIDRKTYKATSPTCHDFCTYIEPPISLLLIGFSLGQIQMIDFYRTEISKFYNQEVRDFSLSFVRFSNEKFFPKPEIN